MSLDRWLDKSSLLKLLESGTGKGVKVGVLDTGVDCSHPDLVGKISRNYEVVPARRGFQVEERDAGEDSIGHGTACAGIIHRLAPDAEIFSLRVIGKTQRDTSGKLLTALDFAIGQKWDVLNLSLGTESHPIELQQLAARAYYAGQLVVAAKDNRPKRIGYPAEFSSVVAVDMDHFDDPLKFRFDPNQPCEVEASGIYVEAPCPGGGYQSYTGTSFACPHVAAMAARLRESIPDLKAFELKAVLSTLGMQPKA